MTHPLRLALWVGLGTAFAEVALQAVERFVLHRLILLSSDFGWMIPLADAAIFLVVGGLLWLLQRRWPSRFTPTVVLGLLLTLGGFTVLLMYPPLHRGAALLLAAGIGLQLARSIPLNDPGVGRFIHRSTIAMLVLTLGCAIVPRLLRQRQESADIASRPAPQAGAPNVLLIILDTVRAMSLSLYGYDQPTTPELERWARRGVVFDMALSPAPWTLPSHASLFTGRWPHELGVDWRVGLDRTYPTLAERLGHAGYRTAGFVANMTYCSEETGINRGFEHWESYPVSLAMIVKSSSLGRTITGADWLRTLLGWYAPLVRKDGAEINADMLRWLSGQPAGPWFVALNYFDAHAPYLPPAPFSDRFGPIEPRQNPTLEPGWDWSAAEVQLQRNAYHASIAALDDQLGRLFDSLEARGQMERTLVIVTADHGEEFYEHQLMDHGNSLYLPSIHVPLMMWLPGTIPEGRRIAAPVTTRDVPATVLALVAPGDSGALAGRPLMGLWSGDTTTTAPDSLLSEVNYASGLPERYPISRGPMRSILLGGLRLIVDGDQRAELYDFMADPGEQSDLAPRDSSAVARLGRVLEALTAPPARPPAP